MEIGREYRKYIVVSWKYWTLLVHEAQYCPGRLVMWSNENIADFALVHTSTLDEYHECSLRIYQVLQDLFAPDLINRFWLGNVTRHLHEHIIPRYERRRAIRWLKLVYQDEHWGEGTFTHGYPGRARMPEDDLLVLRDTLKSRLI